MGHGLGDEEDHGPRAHSTFRNQLIIHKQAKLIFKKGIEQLRRHGFVKKHKIRLCARYDGDLWKRSR